MVLRHLLQLRALNQAVRLMDQCVGSDDFQKLERICPSAHQYSMAEPWLVHMGQFQPGPTRFRPLCLCQIATRDQDYSRPGEAVPTGLII